MLTKRTAATAQATGGAILTVGLCLVWLPLGLIVAGVLVLLAGIAVEREAD